MQKLVVTTNGSITHAPFSTTSGGTFTITSPASLTSSAEEHNVYSGTVHFSFTGGSSADTLEESGTVTPETVEGVGTISASAIKCFADGSAVVLEGDAGAFTTLTGTFIITSTGATVDEQELSNTSVEFSSAGQSKVFAS